MLLLALDTSSQAAAAAILSDGAVLCETILNQKKTHSVKMLPAIEQMMSDTELTFSDIDVFACGAGPGSFTGLRIGVAMTKSFVQALGKKLVVLNSLEILANNVSCFDGFIVPVIYAREDEVFCGIYRQGNGLEEILSPSVLTIGALLDRLQDKKCIFLGDGSLKHQDQIKSQLGELAYFAQSHNQVIRGASAAELAYQKALKNEFIEYNQLEPIYLRPSQAEREFG